MSRIPADSLHAIVTDPPYGVKEYDFEQIEKRANGNGGIWRIPPSFDGSQRAPLPRFTALTEKERRELFRFFLEWSRVAMKVSDCLRIYGTGGLRRISDEQPFNDVIVSERTPRREREIANHPSLKPQSFLRQIVYSALPLGEGVLVDPFMGSGSTVAAAEALDITCIGVERYHDYFMLSQTAIPRLANLTTKSETETLQPTLLDLSAV
jgi:DNA modification methylase